MRYAINKDGAVVNVVEADTALEPTTGTLAIASAVASPGWTFENGTFFAPVLPPPTADAIRAECTSRVVAALGGKRGSINSYGVKLNGLVAIGISQGATISQALTPEQLADVQLLWAIDDWEDRKIAVRQAAILAPSQAVFDDATWPAKPAELTAEWLNGF